MDKGLAEIDIRIVSESDFTELMKEHEHKFYEEVSGLNIPILISEPEREKLIKLNKNYSDNLTLCLNITDKSNNFIGWFYGDQLDRLTFTMHSSFIAPEHRQKGVYSQTLDFVINWAQEKGFVKINSNHSTTNNPIIISKLKKGFTIQGVHLNDRFGMTVDLIYYLNKNLKKVNHFRATSKEPSQLILDAFK
jgi:GNAT superfamily N-acetyltransferase